MATLAEEEPYAAVVKKKYIPVTCSRCFAWNFPKAPERVHLSRCAACHILYYCSKECQDRDWKDGHRAECKFLRSTPDHIPDANTRLVFRMLKKSKSQPELKAFNGRTYDSLMDHCDGHRTSEHVMNEVKKTYAEIERFLGPKTPSFETVFRAFSKKAVNGFGIFDATPGCDFRGTGIYLGLSVHDHSCRPDAFVMIEGSKLQLRTTKKDCAYSKELTICYPSGRFFQNTTMRRISLFSSHLFLCHCEECEDEESDKKRTSGRSICCSNGWFSISDLRCSMCKKEVPSERGAMAKTSNKCLENALIAVEKIKRDDDGKQLLNFVDEWVELFETHKKILSDENTYLFGIADLIYNTALHYKLELSIEFLNSCLPQARKRPVSLNRAMVLCKRFMMYYIADKPLLEIKEALDEAIETVDIVYGKRHELTESLLEKQLELHFASLRGIR